MGQAPTGMLKTKARHPGFQPNTDAPFDLLSRAPRRPAKPISPNPTQKLVGFPEVSRRARVAWGSQEPRHPDLPPPPPP